MVEICLTVFQGVNVALQIRGTGRVLGNTAAGCSPPAPGTPSNYTLETKLNSAYDKASMELFSCCQGGLLHEDSNCDEILPLFR